jgi:hypothetical protein
MECRHCGMAILPTGEGTYRDAEAGFEVCNPYDTDPGSLLRHEPAPRMWHCYSNTPVSLHILTADVEAATAEQAAEIAAGKLNRPGGWTVILGHPVRVAVRENYSYSAERI